MNDRWDEFSKSLAEESVPRRESLRLLGAALAGAFLGPLGSGTAWAGRRDPCTSFCNRYPKRQRSQCIAACQACSGDTRRLCGGSGNFACCASGTRCCNGYCTDVANDFDNCGACGAPCAYPGRYEDGACVDGQCFHWCVEGAGDCGDGTCMDLSYDPNNCGACRHVCAAGAPFCTHGICTSRYCNGANLDWDANNCGVCGYVCPPGAGCAFGICGTPGGEGGAF